MTDFSGVLNPYKAHVHGLPDNIPTVEGYPGESREGLCVYPIFLTQPGDKSIEHHIVKSACWSRRSFIEFTDARELDIGFKFYVELVVKDRACKLLADYGIDIDKDVLYFDGREFTNVERVHLGKKLAMFGDEQFKDYKWVWQLDADIFLASPNRNKHSLFRELLGAPQEIGVGEAWQFSPEETLKDKHWWWYLADSDDDEAKQAEWLRRAKKIASPQQVKEYTTLDSQAKQIGGWIYAFPASHFLTERKGDCEWVVEAGRIIQDDEAVFSVWDVTGRPLVDISKEITSIPTVKDIEFLVSQFEKGQPYILHIGGMPFEYFWRKAFDAL